MTKVNDNALDLLKKRYFRENEKTWEDLCKRVCEGVVQAEDNDLKDEWYNKFYNMMTNLEFIPSTPCLVNSDINNVGQLSSCFIINIKDNIDSIYHAKSECAKIFQKNGGVGFNISTLRPKGTAVETSKGYSCGTIGFMEEFDLTADVVTRNNIRKGAVKIDLNDWHPDIIDFINCKDDTTKLTHMNISVSLSNKFMNAVKNNENWELIFPDYSVNKDTYNNKWDGNIDKWIEKGYPVKIYQTLNARELYTKIMEHAWKTGEPGVSYRDLMDSGNPNPHLGSVDSTNPCAEFCSIPYNSCNLGSINLTTCVVNGKFDFVKFENLIKTSVRFLDNMITVNKLPLSKIEEVTKSVRSVGLGVMGLADCMYMLKIPYSPKGYEFIDTLFKFLRKVSEDYSIKLAEEKGVYPAWEGSTWSQNNIKIRNSNFLSIAPTGSISFIANVSGGLEPNFALTFSRRTNEGDIYYVTNSIFENELKSRGLYSKDILQKIIDNNGSCVGSKEIPKDIQEIFVTASDVTPKQHAEVVGIIQKHVDLSTSKTINLSNSATVKDIEDVYMYAWELGCKGVTVYRDGCRDNQTLSVSRDEKKEITKEFKFDIIEPIKKDDLGETYGTNVKEKVACGNLYLNLCRDENGYLSEIFINTSKGGICQSNINALSRLISMALRGGIKVEAICDQLMGIKCPACTILRSQGKDVNSSCPDAIGQYILEKYNQGNTMIVEKVQRKKKPTKNEKMKCPNCGEQMRLESGCVICKCGFSRCG